MSTSATYAVNLPLTNYIIGWYGTQTHDPARFLAPGTQAPGLLTTYKRYLRQDAFAASDSLPKDGAAAKIVAILKDVAKYGVLNEATVKQLEALSMRINADDAAGQRVVSLVRELVQGELGRILTTMSRPQPARPRRVTPEGRDLDAEDEVRTRIRAGAQAPLPHPQTAPQPATGQGYNAMIGEFARQMFGQGETSGRILDVMQQFLAVARQSASQASQYDARLRKMEQEVATLQSRASFGR